MNRKGDWFLTYTGRKFWPLDPKPEDVCIEDIAHHLSLCCRFNGACRVHYSVAQHSMMVADLVPGNMAFYGLMHDAAEAYVGDMVRPLKHWIPTFQAAEALVWSAIVAKFNIATDVQYAFENIKAADDTALMTERRDLLIESPYPWTRWTERPALEERIQPMLPAAAEKEFRMKFEFLKPIFKT